jgi:predicted GNAT superfamily acetyltransferase
MTTEQIVLRKCEDISEFEACVRLEKEVWKFEDADLVPLPLFVVASKIGGQVLGAFDGRKLVGFVLAIPGSRAGHPYLHSHMLAVRESYRNAGLGRRLKLFQYRDALDRGFELIEWTFDPLEIKNAYLNIARLGAIMRRYNANQYGCMSSALQGGLPSDRLVAEWWLLSHRVKSLLQAKVLPRFNVEREIHVPAAISEWKASSALRAKAAAVQMRNREQFTRAFDHQLSVLGFRRDDHGNGTYLLGRWDEDWSYALPR